MSRWGLGVVAVLVIGVAVTSNIAACAPVPQLPRLTVSTQETADLTLRLELSGPGRALQYVEGSDRVHITIDGPDLTAPYEKLVMLNRTAATLVSMQAVPIGAHRLVAVQCLDADNQPIPGAILRTGGAITAGANTFGLSQAATAVGEVAARLLALDREKSTQVLAKVPWSTLESAVAGYARELKAPHFALLDAPAIASAVHTANGVFPAATSALLRAHGAVELRPAAAPPLGGYMASVSDPASRPVYMTDGGPLLIDHVAPGTWTLTLTPLAPGLPARTQSIQVVAGATLSVPLTMSTSEAKAALAAPLGTGGAAVLPVGGVDTLVSVAGTTYSDADGLLAVQTLTHFPATGGQTTGHLLAQPVVQTAVAVHGGKLYWFGGRTASEPVGDGLVYDPAASATPAPTAPLPGGLVLKGASAGAIGDSIYLAGGLTDDNAAPHTATLAYDPAGAAWRTDTLPALNPSRTDMASSVVNGVWYVFGGATAQAVFAGGAIQAQLVATDVVSAFTPGDTPRWETKAAMPTPRFAAAAAVVDGRVWVIGGAGLMGRPSSAVEVYDPAADSWTVQPPLRRARAFPAVGVLNGKIHVIGGVAGGDPTTGLSVADVEVLTP